MSCRIIKEIFIRYGSVTMGLMIWILIGAIVGWLANSLRKTKKTAANVECVLAGIAGGTIGGLLTNVFYPPGGLNISFTWQTAFAALVGALAVLSIYFIFERKLHY